MPVHLRRWTVVLATVLLCALAGSPAGAADAPPPPATGDVVSFGISPARPDRPDARSFLSYSAAPGSTIQDNVALLNQDDSDVGLDVYGGDVVQSDHGLAVLPHDQVSTDAGSWLTFAGPSHLDVPAQSSATGVGYRIVPFTLTIPTNAQPGDHVGGIVASLVTLGQGSGNTPAIQLDQRVVARVYVRVAGELEPGLEVTALTARWIPGGPFAAGDVAVSYTLRNTGNVRMAVEPSTRVAGPLGLLPSSAKGPRVDDLLPGAEQQQSYTVHGVWPLVLESVVVTAKAVAPAAGIDPGISPSTGSIHLWAVPWVVLAIVLLLIAFLVLRTVRRRRRPTGRRAAVAGRPLDAPRPDSIHSGSALYERQHDVARVPSRKERGPMRLKKALVGVLAGSLAAGAVAVAVAGPAAAIDEGTALTGNIRWHTVSGPLSAQTAATTISSGVSPTAGVNPRPWQSLTVDQACPAGTDHISIGVRIPQSGVPETEWDQVPIGADAYTSDASGRFYTTSAVLPDRISRAQILQYNVDHPSANGNQFPFVVACRNSGNTGLGFFKTTLTVKGTLATDYSWSIPDAPALSSGPTVTATTTALAAVASGANLVLNATVAPTAAGTVTFSEGATTLGTGAVNGSGAATFTVLHPTAGVHTYKASFAPTDTTAFGASASADTPVTITALPDGTITITLGVPPAPLGEPGSLVFTVPSGANVDLTGQRDSGNTRVTATGALPTLTVNDTRRDDLLTGWQVNVQASDFTGGAGTVSSKYLGWTPALPIIVKDAGAPLLAQAGTSVASFLDNASSSGLSVSQLLGKSTANGRGTTTLGAALNLAIPAGTNEGSYTSTVTVTLVGG